VTTARARKAIGPAQPLQVIETVRIGPEPRLQLADGRRVVHTGTRLGHPSIVLRLHGYPQSHLTSRAQLIKDAQ